SAESYFSDVLIEVNFVRRFVPSPFTIEMIASEMPAAIKPYSMAVAPLSSFKNLMMVVTLSRSPVQENRSGSKGARDSLATSRHGISQIPFTTAKEQG